MRRIISGWSRCCRSKMAVIRNVVLAAVVLVICGIQPTAAHGYIVREVPENRAVLERAPVRLQYWFSEALEPDPRFSSVRVRDQNGIILATGGVDAGNPARMSVRLPPDLPDGAYIVELRPAFASDGHVVAESRVFFVGEMVSGVEGEAANGLAVPLEVVWRALLLASTMLLFGAFTLYGRVLLPAWGSPVHPGGLPPRVMRRLAWVMGLAFGGVVAANVLALMQQSMTFFGTGLDQVVAQSLWQLVRIGSRFGDVWNARMVFVLIAAAMFAASLYVWRSNPALIRPFWIANGWVLALVIGSFSVVSHAAGSLMLPWLGILIDWIHTLGVGFWVGGLVALVLVLPPALQPYSGEARRTALLAVMRRFSRLALISALLVIATGIYSALTWIATPADVATGFGASLLVKLAMVGLLLAVGGLHYVALTPQRFAALGTLVGSRVGGMLSTLRLEVLFALLTLTAAALLTATPVPVPEFAARQIQAPRSQQRVGAYTVEVAITPGGPGVNTYDVTVTRDQRRFDDAVVRVQNVSPERDWRSDWVPLEPAGDGLYVAAGAEIDTAGLWWTLIDIQDGDDVTRAAFTWTINAEAAVIQARGLGFLNGAALLGVVIVSAWAAYPAAKQVTGQLGLNAFNIQVGVAAVVLTIAVMAAGTGILQDSQRRYQETLNPPPQRVNTALPDAESLTRGLAVFEAACSGWTGDALTRLVARLPRTRDEALFAFTRDGWDRLPACDALLADQQRWDLVNFIRTLDRAQGS